MEKPNLVLITGGTGYVGSEILDQTLAAGYSVRATARAAKVEALKSTYPDAHGKLEVVEMADLISDAGKWPTLLEGVDAVVHVAAHVFNPGRTSEEIYSASIEGTQKLLDALENSSVKRFVFTSSIAALLKRKFYPDFSDIMTRAVFNHNTWAETNDTINPKQTPPLYTYLASKAIAEKLVWKAAERYPHIDFTTILPPSIYGWFSKGYSTPKSVPELNGNQILYQLIQKDSKIPKFPLATLIHNKDVAKAHVLALTTPISSKDEKKRLIISLGTMTWVEAIEFLKTPEVVAKFKERGYDIVARLPDVSAAGMQSQYILDISLSESMLGLKKDDYISWQETLLEVMPNLMDWEKARL